MSINRRLFLGGVLAVAGAKFVPAAPVVPVLWGDMVHDDAPALNAMLQGRPYHCENFNIIHRTGTQTILAGGAFLVRSKIETTVSHVTICGCVIRASDDFKDDCIFEIVKGDYLTIFRNVLHLPPGMSLDQHPAVAV